MTIKANTPGDENVMLELGRRVLQSEAQAINKASERLDNQFCTALEKILACQGKVIICGIGKSGHIGKKISATFSSTGTPSIFVHPTEALHGDLGVFGPSDLLLAIAYSGETYEVLQVVKYCQQLGITRIALTGNKESTLAKWSDIVIDAQVENEAHALNIAPSSSSTLSLALGDALALSAMEMRGTTLRDFARFHPGGSLGLNLVSVKERYKEIGRDECLQSNASAAQALTSLNRENVGLVPVVDKGQRLIGCVSDGDIRRAIMKFKDEFFSKTVSDLMSRHPKLIHADEPLAAAILKMSHYKISSLFVTDQPVQSSGSEGDEKYIPRTIVGMVNLKDISES